MQKRRLTVILAIMFALALIIGISAAAAPGTPGSSDDPLITLSYLTGTLMPSIEEDFEDRLEEQLAQTTATLQSRIKELEDKLAQYETQGSTVFTALTLESGAQLTCGAGAELMLREGSLSAQADMADLTGGGSLAAGTALEADRLYMASAELTQLTTPNGALVMIRGSYRVS